MDISWNLTPAVLSVTNNHIIKSDGIVYHNNGRQDDWGTAINEYNTRINTSIALELAKHVLVKLVDGQSVESLVEEFDNDTRFINGIVEFLIDMGWVEYNHIRGLYQMTKFGEINVSVSKVIIWIWFVSKQLFINWLCYAVNLIL